MNDKSTKQKKTTAPNRVAVAKERLRPHCGTMEDALDHAVAAFRLSFEATGLSPSAAEVLGHLCMTAARTAIWLHVDGGTKP